MAGSVEIMESRADAGEYAAPVDSRYGVAAATSQVGQDRLAPAEASLPTWALA
jgi:hypothetical protein